MSKNILVLIGHPNDKPGHFCRALAEAYAEGAEEGRHIVAIHDMAKMNYEVLRDPAVFSDEPPPDVAAAQGAMMAADHMAVFYPIWLGSMPAYTKAFFEQFVRNDFALAESEEGGWPRKMLQGRSAHVVVTMGMPSTAYRMFFGAHGVKSFESSVLGMAGFGPVRDTLIGGVGPDLDPKTAEKHLARMRDFGRRGV
ncbi:MAG: NAD(P)H-dependent oxidoreductase [Pseudomonadota bacterium]